MCMQNCGMTKKAFEKAYEEYENMVKLGLPMAIFCGSVGDALEKKYFELSKKIINYQKNHKLT